MYDDDDDVSGFHCWHLQDEKKIDNIGYNA